MRGLSRISFLAYHFGCRFLPCRRCLCVLFGDHVECVPCQFFRLLVTVHQHLGVDSFRVRFFPFLECLMAFWISSVVNSRMWCSCCVSNASSTFCWSGIMVFAWLRVIISLCVSISCFVRYKQFCRSVSRRCSQCLFLMLHFLHLLFS